MGEIVGHGSYSPDAPQAQASYPEQPSNLTVPFQDGVLPSDYVLLSPEMALTRKQYLDLNQGQKQAALEALLRLHVTADGPHKQGIVGAQIDKLIPFEMLYPISPLEKAFYEDYGDYVEMRVKDNETRFKTALTQDRDERIRLKRWYEALSEDGREQVNYEVMRRDSGTPLNLVSPNGTIDVPSTPHKYKNARKIRHDLEQKVEAQLKAEEELQRHTPTNDIAA